MGRTRGRGLRFFRAPPLPACLVLSTPPFSDDGTATPSLFDTPAVPYRPFLDIRGPDAPTARDPDIGRFLCLPFEAALHGFVHTRGRNAERLRWEPAVLSAMGWLWKTSKGRAETLTYHDGGVVEIGASEFVASVYGIAALI